MSCPKITADMGKLRENITALCGLCHASGISVAAVTKGVCADGRIVELINASGADIIADSRIINLAGIRTDKPKLLIRIPMPSEAGEVVKYCDMSFASEIYTVGLVGAEAKRQGKKRKHRIVLMADMGDLREGVFYKNEELIYKTAEAVMKEDMLELYGLGVNLSCFGGIVPDETNLGGLVDIAERLRKRYSIELPMVSGGNSSTMTMLTEGRVPEGITNLRIGEAYLLGNDTSESGKRVPGLNYDAFRVSAEIVELQHKPSKPIGSSGPNAFGEAVSFPDRGEMVRAILALGRQDTDPDGLTPLDENAEILGASSDHLIVNVTGCREYKVGDAMEFVPGYGALLKAYTSKYVQKEYKGE